jgi:hypothetical protein
MLLHTTLQHDHTLIRYARMLCTDVVLCCGVLRYFQMLCYARMVCEVCCAGMLGRALSSLQILQVTFNYFARGKNYLFRENQCYALLRCCVMSRSTSEACYIMLC